MEPGLILFLGLLAAVLFFTKPVQEFIGFVAHNLPLLLLALVFGLVLGALFIFG